MKRYNKILTAILVFMSCMAYSQQIADLEGINYQAVAIDTDGKETVGKDVVGKPLYNKDIGVKFTITSSMDGNIYYQEEHSTTTNEDGLFSLNIGTGEVTPETDYTELLEMPWINGDQWLKVEIAIGDDGDFEEVSNQKFMAVPYAYYTDDIADDAITTEKILDSTILNQDMSTESVDTRVIEDSTILNEDVSTGAVDTRVILDSTILNEDLSTGSVDTRVILDSTILNEDMSTGSVDTRVILDSTILNEDMSTGSVDTRVILDSTILNEDMSTGSVDTRVILDSTILNRDIDTGAIDSRTILNESIQAIDIGVGEVTTDEILNETILNEDIANATIDLTTKVDGILPVDNGGTGIDASTAANGTLLIGNGTGFTLDSLTAGSGIIIDNTAGGIEISSGVQGVNSAVAGNVNPNVITDGDTWISPAIPLTGVDFGNIVVGSIDTSLEGCQMTTYVTNTNIIKVSIYNGTGGNVNLGNGLELRVLVVQ